MYFQGPWGIDVEQGKLSTNFAGNKRACTFIWHIRVLHYNFGPVFLPKVSKNVDEELCLSS